MVLVNGKVLKLLIAKELTMLSISTFSARDMNLNGGNM